MVADLAPVDQSSASVQTVDGLAGDVLTKAIDFAIQSLGQNTLRRNIHNYNGSLLAYTHQCDMANRLKLSEDQKRAITPFPDARSTTVNTIVAAPQASEPRAAEVAPQAKPVESPATAKKPGLFRRLLPWVLAGATGGAAGLGGMVLNQWLHPAPAVQPAPPSTEIHNGEIGVEVE
jgi:hypothetical protein